MTSEKKSERRRNATFYLVIATLILSVMNLILSFFN